MTTIAKITNELWSKFPFLTKLCSVNSFEVKYLSAEAKTLVKKVIDFIKKVIDFNLISKRRPSKEIDWWLCQNGLGMLYVTKWIVQNMVVVIYEWY